MKTVPRATYFYLNISSVTADGQCRRSLRCARRSDDAFPEAGEARRPSRSSLPLFPQMTRQAPLCVRPGARAGGSGDSRALDGLGLLGLALGSSRDPVRRVGLSLES